MFFRIKYSAKYTWSPFRIPQSILACILDIVIYLLKAIETTGAVNFFFVEKITSVDIVDFTTDNSHAYDELILSNWLRYEIMQI